MIKIFECLSWFFQNKICWHNCSVLFSFSFTLVWAIREHIGSATEPLSFMKETAVFLYVAQPCKSCWEIVRIERSIAKRHRYCIERNPSGFCCELEWIWPISLEHISKRKKARTNYSNCWFEFRTFELCCY